MIQPTYHLGELGDGVEWGRLVSDVALWGIGAFVIFSWLERWGRPKPRKRS